MMLVKHLNGKFQWIDVELNPINTEYYTLYDGAISKIARHQFFKMRPVFVTELGRTIAIEITHS